MPLPISFYAIYNMGLLRTVLTHSFSGHAGPPLNVPAEQAGPVQSPSHSILAAFQLYSDKEKQLKQLLLIYLE